jgi:probable rRNA maturation factor
MIHIQARKMKKVGLDRQLLEKAVQETLLFTGHSQDIEMTLVLSEDQHLQHLNRDFMGIDSPTDVLSFPAGFIDPDSQQNYLGDIVISVPRAQEQAVQNQQTLMAEMLLLTVHGTLHLLGYDHAEPEEKDRMWLAQKIILERLEKS